MLNEARDVDRNRTATLLVAHPGRQMLDGTIRVLLAEALFPLTGVLTAAFLTRRLGPEGYGLFTLAATLVGWIEWSITSAFARATVKFIGEAEDWRPVGTTVLRLHLAASSSAALLLWLLSVPIARLLNELMLAPCLWLFALGLPFFSLAQAQRNILVGVGAFGPRALASAGRWIARLLLVVLLVEVGFSVYGAILGSIGASLVEVAISRCYVRPSLFCRTPFPARQLWGYAVPLFLSALSLSCYNKLDLFALKMLGGTAGQAGIYGAAQNVSLLPSLFALSFAPLLLSTLSRVLHAGDLDLAREMGRNAMRLVIGLLPFAVMTAGTAPEIVTVIFGPAFLPAAPLVAVLIFGALALVIVSVATVILTAAGRPGWTFALTGPLVPLAIAGHLVLIPWLGAIGASLVTTLFASVGALAAVLAVYRLWQILPPPATVCRSIVVCGVAYALAMLWPTADLLLLVKLPAISLVSALVFLALGELTASERMVVRSLLRWYVTPEHTPREV